MECKVMSGSCRFLLLVALASSLVPRALTSELIGRELGENALCIVQPSGIHRKPAMQRKLDVFPACSKVDTLRTLNITPAAKVWHPRLPVEGLSPPRVVFAALFNYMRQPPPFPSSTSSENTRNAVPDVGPSFKIAMPMYFAQHYVRQTLAALLEKTTGVWSLDLIVDFSLDNTENAVLQTLLPFLRQSRKQIEDRISFPLAIRVIRSSGYPMFECQAENLAFSTSPLAEFYVSVQADMMVLEKGWNEILALPAVAFEDVFSVSGHCAHNLRNPPNFTSASASATDSPLNGWHNIGHCMPNDLKRYKNYTSTSFKFYDYFGNTLRNFFVRDSSNRGPLIMRGAMLRSLGFFDEMNWLNGNDDHDIHIRAYLEGRWVTGFFELPFHHISRDKPREDRYRTKLIQQHELHCRRYGNASQCQDSPYPSLAQREVVRHFVDNRDGGYTGWRYKKHPIVSRNKTYYRDLFLRQRISPLQQRIRSKGRMAYLSSQLPVREETRQLSDQVLFQAKANLLQLTDEAIKRWKA